VSGYVAGLATGTVIIQSVAGQPYRLTMSADKQSLVAGNTAVSSTAIVTVQLVDYYNNPVSQPGVRITMELDNDTYAELYDVTLRDGAGNPLIDTDNTGTCKIKIKPTQNAGVVRITASDKTFLLNLVPVTYMLPVVPGTPSRVILDCTEQRIVTNDQPAMITAQIVDSNNNVVTSSTGTVTFSVYNGTVKRDGQNVQLSSGTGTFWYSDTAAGMMQVIGYVSGIGSGTVMIENLWNSRAGGEYVFDDPTIKLSLPAWALDKNVTIVLSTAALVSHTDKIVLIPGSVKELRLYNESGTEIVHPLFTKSVTVIIKYIDSNNDGYEDVAGVSADNLKLFYVNDTGGLTWVRVSSVDKTNKTVVAEVNHFTVFVLGSFSDTDTLLYQNYPNPFNPYKETTRIEYSMTGVIPVKTGIQCSVKVYNIAGELVRTLVDKEVLSGTKTYVDWDGTNDNNELVSDGVYLCQLVTPDYKKIIKIVVVKTK
jgi:flagellar hook assembly protein FlgD